MSERLHTLVAAVPAAHDVRRFSVAVCPGGGRDVGYFAFRPTSEGDVVEDELTRGIHPMVGRRLNLWRLRNFHVTRVEAPEDVLLYECVARENPTDRRLVALAQVRQMSVVHDETGRPSSRCRTPSVRSSTAWRRSAGPGSPAEPPAPSST